MRKILCFLSMILCFLCITNFKAEASSQKYKKYYDKNITITESEDGKYYMITDKTGKFFQMKKVNKKMYVNSWSGLNVRKGPTLKAKRLKRFKHRKKVTVIGQSDNKKNKWTLIKYKKGYAFVWGKYLSKKKPKNRKYLGKFTITAYEWDGSRCANGNWPRKRHTVACNSLKLGTKVYIQGVGKRVVEDRGASWHSSNWMDIYLGSVSACNKWGVRTRKVWIIK